MFIFNSFSTSNFRNSRASDLLNKQGPWLDGYAAKLTYCSVRPSLCGLRAYSTMLELDKLVQDFLTAYGLHFTDDNIFLAAKFYFIVWRALRLLMTAHLFVLGHFFVIVIGNCTVYELFIHSSHFFMKIGYLFHMYESIVRAGSYFEFHSFW